MAERPQSICFVAPKAYGLLAGRDDIVHLGGAEVQQVLLARELARRGFRVAFVTLDHGQPDGIEHEGIQVFRAYGRDAGRRGTRFLHPRWTGLWGAMKRADCEVYYQRGAGSETGQVGLWCRRHRRRFAFAIASDSNCEPSRLDVPSMLERALYRLGLRCADVIIAQTSRQADRMRAWTGRPCAIVRNGGIDPLRGEASDQVPAPADPPRILWVGRVAAKKRFDWLLCVARECREFEFDVVGPDPNDNGAAGAVTRAAQVMSNVTLHGPVSRREIHEYYRRARLLLCTSLVEGFPNTFVEAWACGRPVVSTVDTDGALGARGLGRVGRTVSDLVSGVRELSTSASLWRQCATRARDHFLREHDPARTVDALVQELGFRAVPAHATVIHSSAGSLPSP